MARLNITLAVSMDPDERYWQVLEPIADAISIYDGPGPYLQQFSSAPAIPRDLFAAHSCQSEVCNGGFEQFFCNSTGVLGPESISAFRSIGMHNLASLVEDAVRWFGPEYPRDGPTRCEQIETYKANHGGESPFEHLHERFFQLIRSEHGGFESAADAYAERFAG